MRWICILGALLFSQTTWAAGPLEFELAYGSKEFPGPFTGRVYVMLTKGAPRGLMSGPD